MELKRKASVLAVALALASPAAWAGVSSDAANANESQGTPAVPVQPSASKEAMDGAKESLGWTYVNGESTDSPEQSAQAITDDDGRTEASTQQEPQEDQTAASQEAQGGGDQAAAQGEEEELQAAKPQSAQDQSAQSDEQSGEQSAKSEDDDEDQSAKSEEQQGDSEQAAKSEDDDEDQAAMSEEQGDEQSAQSEGQGKDQAADSNVPAGLEGKVIVIVPRDWQGSLKDLVAALQASPDAKDIVIVQQGQPQAGNESEDYFADGQKPASDEER